MKNFIYVILCGMMAFFVPVPTSYAAFPVHAGKHSISIKTEERFEAFVNAAIGKYHRPIPPVRDTEDEGGKVLNLLAFGLGVTSVVALITAFLEPTFVFALGGYALMAAIAAIITGDKAMELRPLRGLGTTGFVLGIINLSAIVLIGVLALLYLFFVLLVN